MRQIIRKAVTLILGMFFLIPIFSNSAFANELDIQAPNYRTSKYQKFIDDNVIHCNKIVENRIAPLVGARKQLNVPLKKQSKYYFCGPASLQMVIEYKGKSYSQGELAQRSKTSISEGTYVYRMVETLNSILNNQYVYVNLTDQAFSLGLIYSIDKGYPVICHTLTSSLKHYKGKGSGHYVVATGYAYGFYGNTDGVSDVYYNDPNNLNQYYGKHTDTIDAMTKAIKNRAGYFIRCR